MELTHAEAASAGCFLLVDLLVRRLVQDPGQGLLPGSLVRKFVNLPCRHQVRYAAL